MIPGNKYTYITFINNGLILWQWGGRSTKYFLFRYGSREKNNYSLPSLLFVIISIIITFLQLFQFLGGR